MSAHVPCPNPACKEGHVDDEPCTCPEVTCWDDEVGYFSRVEHDVMTCETLCPCCCGHEDVSVEEALDWIETHQDNGLKQAS